jgi:hypothetical protein
VAGAEIGHQVVRRSKARTHSKTFEEAIRDRKGGLRAVDIVPPTVVFHQIGVTADALAVRRTIAKNVLLDVDIRPIANRFSQTKVRGCEAIEVDDRGGVAELACPIEQLLETCPIDVEPGLEADDVHLRDLARSKSFEGLQVDLHELNAVAASDGAPEVEMGENLRGRDRVRMCNQQRAARLPFPCNVR